MVVIAIKLRLIEITGHPGYFVDTNGNIYSGLMSCGTAGIKLRDKPKLLKCSVSKTGHKTIRIRGKTYLTHRLIYSTFVGEIPKGMVIRHLNDIPGDNRLENLCLGTQKDNVRDCIKNGHFKSTKKLDDEQIKVIKEKRKHKTVEELSSEYKVSEKTIRNVINNYYKEETR